MGFKFLPVKLLFHNEYYDGPLSGVCEYRGEKLYFKLGTEELWFKYAEQDPVKVAIADDECQSHRLRIYTLYKLPQDTMENIIFNHELFSSLKNKDTIHDDYSKQKKELPAYFSSWRSFQENAWQYAIGYTTDDVWDNKEWLEERLRKFS